MTETSADESTVTQVTAEHYINKSGGIPSLVVTIDVPRDLEPGTDWIIDSVIHIDREGTITVLCYPNGDDEGWERIGEVGEW